MAKSATQKNGNGAVLNPETPVDALPALGEFDPNAAPEKIEIKDIEVQEAVIVLSSITPLITHRWSEKAKQMMRDKQQKNAKAGRTAKNPEDDCREATYFISLDPPRYGFPAVGFKAAMVDAAVTLGHKKTEVRRAFHIVGDAQTPDGDMVEIHTPEPPVMREDMVKVGMGTADLRYRPEFKVWSARLHIRYDKAQMSISQIVTLANKAGFSTGVGEWRVERDGPYGQFTVSGVEAV